MATVDCERIDQLETTLRKMELTLAAIAEAVVWTDATGTIEWCNAAFSQFVNALAASLVGAQLEDIFPLSQQGQKLSSAAYPHQQICAGKYSPTTYELSLDTGVRFLEISGQCLEVEASHPLAILVIRDITAAESAIQQPATEPEPEQLVSLLQATLESTANGILVVHRDRNTPIHNQKFLQMWGIPASLMQLGQADERLQFLSQQTQDPEKFIARVGELFRDRPEETTLDLLELKDGRFFECYSQPQRIADEIVGRVWSFRDVTLQKHTEQTIQENEARLKLALEAGHMGTWDWNILTNEVKWSDNLEVIHGMPPGSFGGNFNEFLEIVHSQDRDWVSQVINQAVATGVDYEIEFRILWADGSTHWIAGKGKTFCSSTGQAVRMIGLGMDITERKQAEETLRRNNALLKAQQEAAIDGILVVDEHQQVTFYNQRFCQLWQMPPEVIETGSDRQFLDWVRGQLVQPKDFFARIAYLYSHPEETSQDEFVLKDGRTLDRYSAAVRSPSGECYGRVWYFRDITQQKQAEASLRYNESKFRNLFENSQMGIFRSRVTDGLILEANQRFVELAGYTSVTEVIHQVSTVEFYVDPAKRQEVLAQLRHHGKFINFEMQFRRRDGVLRWGLFSLYLDTTENCLDCVVTDISDRKATEEALRASEAQYRDLVQTANSVILRWDTTGKVCFLNEYGQRFFGFSGSEILGQNVVGTIVPETETSGRDLQALMLDIQHHPENYLLNENENICKNGDRVWVAWANKPILDAQGYLVEILSVGTDATQRKQAEAALAESEAKFRNIVENANDVLFVIDAAGVFTYVSPNLFTVTGFEPAELEGKPFAPLVHPDDLDSCMAAVNHVFTTEQNQSGIEYRIQYKDGNYHWQVSNLAPTRDASGQLLIIGVARDITDRKRSEAALLQSERKFRSLFEATSLAVVIADQHHIFDCNHAAEQLFGCSRQALVGKNPAELSPPVQPNGQDSLSLARQHVAIALAQGNHCFEWVHRRADGTDFPVEVWITAVEIGQEKFVQGIIQDLTERKQAEAALAERATLAAFQADIGSALVQSDSLGLILNHCAVAAINHLKATFAGIWLLNPATSQLELQAWAGASACYAAIQHQVPLDHPPDSGSMQASFGLQQWATQTGMQTAINIPLQLEDQLIGQVGLIARETLSPATQQVLQFAARETALGIKRKQTEAALRFSETRFRALFESTGAAVMLSDEKGRPFAYCNSAAEQLFGYTRQELAQKHPGELSPPTQPDGQDSITLSNQHMARVLEKGSHHFEWIHRRADGTDFPADVWLTYVNVGAAHFGQAVVYDLTDRKRAEAALAESEAKFRSIVENINDVIFVHDLDMILTYVSPNIVNVFGYSAAEIEGQSIAAFVHPEDLEICFLSAQKVIDYGERQLGDEVRIRHKNGSWCWISTSISPVPNPHGSISILGVARDITEQKVAEAALRRSELKYRNIFENSQVGICRTRLDNGLFLDANQRCAEILGYDTAAELLNQHYSTEFYLDRNTRQQMQAELLEKGEVHNFEMQLRRRDGSTSWALFSFRLQAEEGCIDSVIADINDRKHREEALRLIVEGTAAKTGDEFFQSCVRYLAEVLQVRYALVTAYTDATKTRVRSLAFWGGEAITENFAYSPKGAPCENVLQGRMCFYPEGVQARFPDDPDLVKIGAESYLGMPLTDSSGNILGHLAVLDVKPMAWNPGRELILRIFAARTGAEIERKEADEALERRAQLESLLSQISRHFIDQTADSAINFTLAAIAKFVGAERSCIFAYSDNRTRYHLIYEWCAPGIAPLSVAARGGPIETFPQLHQMISRDYVLQVQSLADLPPDSQERNLFASQSIQSLVAVPMTHGGEVIGFIGMDVVRFAKVWSQEDINLLKLVGELIAIGRTRYQAEEALRIAKEAAESANRAKSVFLANMSHELRTPLNAILGFAQLMERDRALTSRQRESLATINRSGEHLLNLINDVLEMSKIEAGRIVLNLTSFDLYHLLRSLQEMFQIRAQAKQLALQFLLAPDLPQYIEADEGKLRQVLINLLGNAVKFTDTGSVRLQVKPIFPHPSGPTTSTTATQLAFEVEDTGRGISPEDIDKLFQPFFQTASAAQAREGTGLGLTISRQFIQLMGGEIHLKSEVGQGSSFSFEIAIAPGTPPSIEANPTRAQGRVLSLRPGQPQYRVLIVDDKFDNQDLLTQLLSSVGFETRTAADGQEAILQWQQWHPHLIWMDMRMPVLDGYEATRQIRTLEASSTAPPTIIIALTASAFEEQRWQILGAGCDDLVRKPFRERLIFDKMAEYLGVQYLYAEPETDPTTPEHNGESETSILTPAALRVMPETWIAQLQQAAVEVDAEQITQLITQIPAIQADLASRLSELLRNFGFDEILDLTQRGTHD